MGKRSNFNGFEYLVDKTKAKPNPKEAPLGKRTLPPIKPPPEKPQTLQKQLDTSDVEKALDRIGISLPPGAYVEHHPTYKVIISNGITFILKPEL